MNRAFSKTTQQLLFPLAMLIILTGCGEKSAPSDGADKDEPKSDTASDALPDGLSPEDAAKVVAKVGERTITVGDVTRQINRLSPYIRRRWAAPEKRKEFLDKLIRVELLSQEAERLGLTEDPEVQRTGKQVMIRLMVKNDLEKEIFPSKIDESVLQATYKEEKSKYERPAQVRASHIVLKTKGEAEKVLGELRARKTDNQFFREKARELSIDAATKNRGGDIGYFSNAADRRDDEPQVDKGVVEAAWELENNGDIFDKIVKSEMGFHIVKLTNKRAEMNRSYESVKRMIENKLLREKRQEVMKSFIEDLKKKANIEIFKENLAKADFELEEGEGDPLRPPSARRPPRPQGPMKALPKKSKP